MEERALLTRRELIRRFGTGAFLFFASSLAIPRSVIAQETQTRQEPDVIIRLRAVERRIPLLEGPHTVTWSYEGELLRGPRESLIPLEGSYLGPTIHVWRGQRVRIIYTNQIPEHSIIHWHGLLVPEEMDGHPRYAVPEGGSYTYEFEVKNRAGTYWYHPHPHGRTGVQVYAGLTGLYIVHDPEEARSILPTVPYDVPIVIQDRSFDELNQLVYLSRMMEQMIGFLGDRILVNGRLDHFLSVDPKPYRLRVLNGSNSRIYKLAWDTGTPITVIGTDGGLLEKAVHLPYVVLSPGERIDLWIDFGDFIEGKVKLLSLPFSIGASGMMGGMSGRDMMRAEPRRPGSPLLQGSSFPVMSFFIRPGKKAAHAPPGHLSSFQRYSLSDAINSRTPRRFIFAMQGMRPTINGRQFELTGVTPEETVQLNTTELWEFVNAGGIGMMGMMQQPHPVHVHGIQFQIVDRQVHNRVLSGWESLNEGFVDQGFKDTVLLLPGTALRVAMRFGDYPGLFLYHCHNLEHEDLGMMRNYRIKS
jgi:FtsP/CotA-like multicopper oxidase with cupredoxin domain